MSNSVSEMLDSAINSIKTMVDVNSVVGDPIKIDGATVIVPVAKISYGFAGGGSDGVSKHASSEKTFAGGIGGGTSVKAEAFLVVSNGNVRIIPVDGNTSTADKIVDMVPGMVDKVSGIFAKKVDGDSKD